MEAEKQERSWQWDTMGRFYICIKYCYVLGAKGTVVLTPLSGSLVYGPGHRQTDSYHTEYEVLSCKRNMYKERAVETRIRN